MNKYLSDGKSNAKTAKNIRDTLILYMSPAKQNSKGTNLCPKASKGCLASCLFTAGRGAYSTTQEARRRRTEEFLNNEDNFLQSLAAQINALASKRKEVAVRLNGTSDTKIVSRLLKHHHIRDNVVFYDYTKIKTRAGAHKLSSGHIYVVTFSRSETNESECIEVLESGGIVAAVFDHLPLKWRGYKVIDGDERDDLMLDVEGPIVLGLRAKGAAKKDNTGFVIKINEA